MNSRIRHYLIQLGFKFVTYKCKKCGKEFTASIYRRIILCPECRDIYDKEMR